MRRYRRAPDHYQTRENFFELFERMKTSVYQEDVSDEDFKKLLFAIQYAERFPLKNSKTGRKARFDEKFLFDSSLKLKGILQNETGGRISLLRFISTYLPIIDYPVDLQAALDKFKINLEEARILSRINRQNLGAAVRRKPSEIRKELIDSHLKRQGTQNELRQRVNERLSLTPRKQAVELSAQITMLDYNIDQQLEFDEFDTEHLLWEEMKSMVYMMREVDTARLDDETTGEILNGLDAIKLKLLKFRKLEKNFSGEL